MIWAQLQTRSYTFDAYAPSREQAIRLLQKAWAKHAKQTGADSNYLTKNIEDVFTAEIGDGIVFRDKEVLVGGAK